MKKIFGSIILLLTLLVFSGCGSKEETKTFISNQNGIDMELVYTYKGDNVSKQTSNNTIPYSALGVATKEEAQAVLDPISTKYQGLEGVEQKIEYKENEAVETLSVDFGKLDFDKAKNVPGMDFSGNTNNGVSMKESEKMLLEDGFELKE
ncbi:YehR family lipoprotein [Bacillus norwichensis]|uniref:DUF1307 domain-containing protein n=1 Tax=Bacillus norwichensis TaxID=2762217 RepID=A0ABR8VN94_9BACI|nr:YehR family protein [Bacillus norwichensis]MBD8006219.1 DUF1307 domain-containing protein [Bacillus norwichensis]